MVHPVLVAGTVVARKNRTVVIDLELAAPSRRVLVLIHVLHLIRRRALAEIGGTSEEANASLLRQRKGSGHGR